MITADPGRQAVLRRMHAASGVQTRHLVMPIESYRDPQSFTQSNDLFIDVAARLAEEALRDALDTAGLRASDIDYVMFTSVTGISAPSIDGLLVARLGLRSDVRRVPMFGLGCVAGASGIARINDYLVGHPNDVAVLLSVELCSLTFQRDDDSMANIVATGLFGDGAAAVVMVGDERAERMPVTGPDVVDSRSQLYPDTEEVLGFNASTTGFRIVLTAEVAGVIESNFGADVAGFLSANDRTLADIGGFVAHPGGPRVLEAFQSALGLATARSTTAGVARRGRQPLVRVRAAHPLGRAGCRGAAARNGTAHVRPRPRHQRRAGAAAVAGVQGRRRGFGRRQPEPAGA